MITVRGSHIDPPPARGLIPVGSHPGQEDVGRTHGLGRPPAGVSTRRWGRTPARRSAPPRLPDDPRPPPAGGRPRHAPSGAAEPGLPAIVSRVAYGARGCL